METKAEHKVSSEQTDIDKVLDKIKEIAEKSADGDYIYRGESKFHDKVCSSLYREYPHTEGVYFDIKGLQDTILEEAKTYIGKTDDIDKADGIGLLTEIQHFGGKTNLIDFTRDYLIALFFACDGSHDEDGRVILLKEESDDYAIEEPGRTINRVEAQRSVFIESPTGFVEPDSVVTIPMDLKFPMLFHLEKYHRISIATIYNDLHGFIRRSASIEFLKGLTCQREASETEDPKEKLDLHKNAIKHYTEAIKLKSDYEIAYYNRGIAYGNIDDPDAAIADFSKSIDLDPKDASAYNNRGNAYRNTSDFEAAIADFNKAIDLDPKDAGVYNSRGAAYADKSDFEAAIEDFNKSIDLDPKEADTYCNRGETWLHLKEWQKAEADLTTAKDMGYDIIESFQNDYESVEDFEAKNEVKVPKDIAELLQRK